MRGSVRTRSDRRRSHLLARTADWPSTAGRTCPGAACSGERPAVPALQLSVNLPAILPVIELPPCAPEQRHPEGSHSGDRPAQRRAPRHRLPSLQIDPAISEPSSPLVPPLPVPDGHIDIRAAG